MNFADKIKNLRLENNLTQDELAKICYVTRNAVSKWENGLSYPSIDTLKIISQYFNISIDELINNENIYSMVVDEKNKNEQSNNNLMKNVLYSLIVFLLFTITGISSNIFFSIVPTGGFDYALIVGPLSFISLGVFIGLLKLDIKNIIISSITSIFFIYIYYEFFTHMDPGLTILIYYILFLIPYFLIKFFIQNKLNNKTNKILSIILISFTFIFTIIDIPYIVDDILQIHNENTAEIKSTYDNFYNDIINTNEIIDVRVIYYKDGKNIYDEIHQNNILIIFNEVTVNGVYWDSLPENYNQSGIAFIAGNYHITIHETLEYINVSYRINKSQYSHNYKINYEDGLKILTYVKSLEK